MGNAWVGVVNYDSFFYCMDSLDVYLTAYSD